MSDNLNEISGVKRFTKSEKFINERKDSWKNLHDLILRINSRGLTSLSANEHLEFPNLYRKIATDSELAKTLELSPDTIDYINILLLHSHNILYTSVKRNMLDIIRGFFNDFSKAFIKNWICYFIIFMLFFVSMAVSFIVIYKNPDLAVHTVPAEYIEMMKDSYSKDVSENRNIFSNIYMYAFYIYNNVSIAFASFLAGVSYGILTIYIILSNGVTIGSIGGLVFSAGHGANFINFVTAHSVFELLGICLAGGSGLALGVSLITATDEKRIVSVVKKAREILPVVFAAAFFIFIAAFIEGFISPSKLPYFVKAFIAFVSFAFVMFFSYLYIFAYVFKKIRRR